MVDSPLLMISKEFKIKMEVLWI